MATLLDHYRGLRRALVRFAAIEFQMTGEISAEFIDAIAHVDRRIAAEELLEATR